MEPSLEMTRPVSGCHPPVVSIGRATNVIPSEAQAFEIEPVLLVESYCESMSRVGGVPDLETMLDNVWRGLMTEMSQAASFLSFQYLTRMSPGLCSTLSA